MPTIFTCGSPLRRTRFSYEGDFDTGVLIRFKSGDVRISHALLRAAVDHFKGREVRGGFSMTDPIPGGFGHWIESGSKALNGAPLTSRHGSFVAAILREMGYLDCILDGNAVVLRFRA